MKIVILKKWPGSNVKYSLWKVNTYTCVGICRFLSNSWGIFALTFKLVTQGIRIFSLLCVEYVQFFYSINFYQLDGNDLYTLCNTLKKNSDARSFQFYKKNNSNHGKQVLQNNFNHWHRTYNFDTSSGSLFRIKI